MNPFSGKLTRRSFLSLSALVPVAALDSSPGLEHNFRYERVLGTSMDLSIWTPDGVLARRANAAVLDEIRRLAAILNTREPESDISRSIRGRDLDRVLQLYAHWERRTGGLLSAHPAGPGTPLNVDALGKAYILDLAVEAAREAVPDLDGLLLNIGGDIVIWGRHCEIAVANPQAPYDNAEPLTRLVLTNSAIATSGTYARGAHILDPRTGEPFHAAASATVVAPDAVTANALATTLCIGGEEEGMRLVESTPGASALRIAPTGAARRSAGFARLERHPAAQPAVPADWPQGYRVTLALTLTNSAEGRREIKRPYVAVWVEEPGTRKLIRVLAFWADQPRYFTEVSVFANRTVRDKNVQASLARATRPMGSYQLVWDGLDDQRKPVPAGSYLIVVEAIQEHGDYNKQSGTIVCEAAPAEVTLAGTPNFEPVKIKYGP